MVKLAYFDIQFDNGNGAYLAGQRISGNVTVNADQPAPIRSVYILFLGETRTYWVNKTSDKIYESTQVHFNNRFDLPVAEKLSPDNTLMPGPHSLPFFMDLPQNLPSTFNDEYGYTRYICSAKVELNQAALNCIPGMSDASCEFRVDKVINIFSLSSLSGTLQTTEPVQRSDHAEIVGCLRNKGSVSTNLKLAKTEFFVGEQITGELMIRNDSRSALKSIDVLLMQHTVFQAISRYEGAQDQKEIVRTIESQRFGPVPRGNERAWKVQIQVPPIPPSEGFGRNLINIAYFMRAASKAGVEITVPISICSIQGNR